MSRATMYDGGGWVLDLPELNVGRFDHGCGHYVDSDLLTVVYLITGGFDGISRLSSTEIMKRGPFGSSQWSLVGPLPTAATLLRGVSLNNRIIMTGEIKCIIYSLIVTYNQVDTQMSPP